MPRYEDRVRGETDGRGAMSGFIGARIEPDPGAKGRMVFKMHPTQAAPAASVKRRRTDLPHTLKARCARERGEFFTTFGYAVNFRWRAAAAC